MQHFICDIVYIVTTQQNGYLTGLIAKKVSTQRCSNINIDPLDAFVNNNRILDVDL